MNAAHRKQRCRRGWLAALGILVIVVAGCGESSATRPASPTSAPASGKAAPAPATRPPNPDQG
jgi:hypothetical protein